MLVKEICLLSGLHSSVIQIHSIQHHNRAQAESMAYFDVNDSNGAFNMLECLKGTVHPKMKLLASFIHPNVVLNLSFFCGT